MTMRHGRSSLLPMVALAVAVGWSLPAMAQSGTLPSKAKEKVRKAQEKAPAPSQQAAPASSAPPPGTAAPAGTDKPLTVIAQDPNHISAVKALEQIRRDEEASSEGTTFTYDPGDRRDPFLSPQDILQAELSGQVCQGEGMECWLIQDVTVIGVLTRGKGNVALVIGPDGYGATLHEGDRLYDGEVRRIDPETGLVIFRQKVNDPTRIKPYRDIEKGLDLKKEGRS